MTPWFGTLTGSGSVVLGWVCHGVPQSDIGQHAHRGSAAVDGIRALPSYDAHGLADIGRHLACAAARLPAQNRQLLCWQRFSG